MSHPLPCIITHSRVLRLTSDSYKTSADEAALANRREYWRQLFAQGKWKKRRQAYEAQLKTEQIRRDDETLQQSQARLEDLVQSALRDFDKTFETSFQAYFGAGVNGEERKSWLPPVTRKPLLAKAFGDVDCSPSRRPTLLPIKRAASGAVSSHGRCVSRSKASRSLHHLTGVEVDEKGAF